MAETYWQGSLLNKQQNDETASHLSAFSLHYVLCVGLEGNLQRYEYFNSLWKLYQLNSFKHCGVYVHNNIGVLIILDFNICEYDFNWFFSSTMM